MEVNISVEISVIFVLICVEIESCSYADTQYLF